MASSRYRIATMARRELDFAIEWAAAEGWNPGLHDAGCFYAADPNGFLLGSLDGEPMACISAVKYAPTFGFLGFYIVRPEYRGQGYGWQIWQAGMDYLAGCNVGLDGVVEQQENYRKAGFQLAHRNIRYEGYVRDSEVRGSEVRDSEVRDSEDVIAGTGGVVPLSSLPMALVMDYDRAFFPAVRSPFLHQWLTQPERTAVGWIQGSNLAGYGVIRACRSGYKVGPLFADTPAGAAKMLVALQTAVPPGSLFYLDVPAVNAAAVDLAQNAGMTPVFETARMYTQSAPDLSVDRTFGITTFELG